MDNYAAVLQVGAKRRRPSTIVYGRNSVTHRRLCTSPAPSFVCEELHHSAFYFVADLPDSFERLALGIVERPIGTPEPGHGGARLAAAHGDEHRRASSEFVR